MYYEKDVLSYLVLDLVMEERMEERIEKRIEKRVVPLSLNVCSSSGVTRSYGWTSLKMSEREKNLYLKKFLPRILTEEVGLRHQYVGVNVMLATAVLKRDGRRSWCDRQIRCSSTVSFEFEFQKFVKFG